MGFQRIGIMSIGEMGFHWAKLLKSHGVEVWTYDKDRGETNRELAENARVKSLPSMVGEFGLLERFECFERPEPMPLVALATARDS